MSTKEGMSYGLMHREDLALKLAMTYHQLEMAYLAPAHQQSLIENWLPVAEMAIHEILE